MRRAPGHTLLALLVVALAAACVPGAPAFAKGMQRIGTAVRAQSPPIPPLVASVPPMAPPLRPSGRPAPPAPPARPGPTPPGPPAPPAPTGLPGRFFAPDSVWNKPLAPDAPIEPTSEQRMAAFRADIWRQMQLKIGPWIDERSNSTAVYVAPPSTPTTRVRITKGGSVLNKPLAAVPIPPQAQAAAGVDAHMTIYQPSTDTMWEFWKAGRDAQGWYAGWGGGMRNVSTSVGYYTNEAWEGLPPHVGWNWGSTASSLPMVGGVVRVADLQRGRIDHALGINIPWPCAGAFMWPAQRTDGTSTAPDCLPEGAHLRLDPRLDISKLSLPPVTRMLAVAAQRYGMIVRDRTKKATTFLLEDPTPTGKDPYRAPGGLYGGRTPRELATAFPWQHVKLLQSRWCTQAPCLR